MRSPLRGRFSSYYKKILPSFLFENGADCLQKEMKVFMFAEILGSPYRFFLAAAVLAAILCLFPARGTEQEAPRQAGQAQGADVPADADLSERTQADAYLHTTLHYLPCGHSVQRRDPLPAALAGMSRALLEKEIGSVIAGASVTGFSAQEVDVVRSTEIPCPLHWVLKADEQGKLCIGQNRSGETLETVRRTDVPLDKAPEAERDALREGRIFDDVQALEGYLESLSS